MDGKEDVVVTEVEDESVLETQVIEEVDGDEDEESQPKVDSIPKSVALQWKKELKEYKKILTQYKEKELQDEQKNKVDSIRQKIVAKGYDEEFAELFGELAGDLLSSVKRDDPIVDEVNEELEELQDYYPNISKQKKEIIDKVKKYRKADPDFTVEDAIKLIGIKSKANKSAKEIELEVEQRQLLSRRNTDKQPAPSSSGAVKDTYPLSDDDKRVLKSMQEHHPDGGWTKKKFYEIMVKNKRR